jgi:predicted transposase YdaD
MLTQDKLWKAIFEDFFPNAVAFYFPNLHSAIDWSRGFSLLDKELKQIFPESEETHRRVDLLVQVWLLDGSERYLLIHVEVQGYKDPNFPNRMFVYFYRLTDRFSVPVVALALLTDSDKTWTPDRYEYVCEDTQLTYRYKAYKLANYSPGDFDKDPNPWALVMKAALIGLKNSWDDESLLRVKTNLYRELRARGYTVDQSRGLFQFIKYYVHFAEKEFYDKFENEIEIIDHSKTEPMGIIELVKEHLIEEAKQEGLEKGLEKGMKKGEEKKARTAINGIIKKYPALPDKEIAEIVDVPVAFVVKVRKEFEKNQSSKN